MTAPLALDALIIGCGFLGSVLLAQLHGTARVIAVTRTQARRAALTPSGVVRVSCDVTGPDVRSHLLPQLADFHGNVFVLLPPSSLADEDGVAVIGPLIRLLRDIDTQRTVLVSSTAVFGDAGGGWVTADSPVTGVDRRARRLVEIENRWLQGGFEAYVLRLGGLYGPGRVVGRTAIETAQSLPGAGDDWLNLVRVEDAAAAVRATGTVLAAQRCGLITDGTPVLRRDYYAHLAALLHQPAPAFAGGASRRAGSRRCDPGSTWAALGLAPVFPDYRLGLRDLV